ncbi:MAG: TlpA disulfide reductase family protein [Chloroflexi bacterium]|nr:TlpA disulfide reductase family protein [Chloroflexota bacterium]
MGGRRRAVRGGTTVLGLAALGLLALMGLMAYGLLRQNNGRGGLSTNEVGQSVAIQPKPASEFRLPLFSGQSLTLTELRGRPVVINFWASWCPPCRVEAPMLERSYQNYKDRVAFVGINIWDSDDAAQQFLRDFHVTYANGPNPKGNIPVEYGVTGIPETYFISKDGTLLRRWIGPITEEQFAATVKDIL